MSNQQWNSDQGASEWARPEAQASAGDEQPGEWGKQTQPQPTNPPQSWGNAPAESWGAPQQPQAAAEQGGAPQSGSGWGQPQQQSSAEWPAPQQSQPSANDWGQAQQQPAQEWGQTNVQPAIQQDWPPKQPTNTGWGQQQPSANPQWAPTPQPSANTQWATNQGSANQWEGQQNWGQQPQQNWQPAAPVEKKPSPFDLSVSKLSLPGAAGTIFMVGAVALIVEWLFGFITTLYGANVLLAPTGWAILNSLLGGLAGVAFKLMVLRVLIEIGVAGTRLLERNKDKDDDKE